MGQRFSYNIEVVLYRVVCELISNTLQHANAKYHQH
jgi:signal transduction histidine kinase